jgi:hypothetical protein
VRSGAAAAVPVAHTAAAPQAHAPTRPTNNRVQTVLSWPRLRRRSSQRCPEDKERFSVLSSLRVGDVGLGCRLVLQVVCNPPHLPRAQGWVGPLGEQGAEGGGTLSSRFSWQLAQPPQQTHTRQSPKGSSCEKSTAGLRTGTYAHDTCDRKPNTRSKRDAPPARRDLDAACRAGQGPCSIARRWGIGPS